MHVEVWSDLVCPWCYLGNRNLRTAIADLGDPSDIDVVHRAFQLHPEAPTVGPRLIEVIAAEEDITLEQATDAVSDVADDAAAVGLDYQMADIVTGNTFDAHRTVLWAREQGLGEELLEVLFSSYFVLAQPIFTPEQLLPFLAQAGCDPQAGASMLASNAYAAQVADDQRMATELGAPGVPFFAFGSGLRLFGAQSVEVLRDALVAESAGQ